MFYFMWIVSAFVAVGVGVFAANTLEKKEQ